MRKITQFIGREDVLMIFCNQLRASVGSFGFGDKWVCPGGNAVPFHSSIRLRLTKLADIKREDAVIGITVQAQLKKNKIAPPARKCTFDIYFDKGIDDESSWFDNLVLKGIITRPTKMTYELDLTELGIGIQKFKSGEWRELISDLKTRNYVRQLVVKANTIDYTNLNPSFDDLVESGAPEKDEVAESGELIDQ